MKRTPFQFSLLGMLGVTTLFAVALSSLAKGIGVAGLLSLPIALIVWMTSVLSLGIVRDCYAAARSRRWAPLRGVLSSIIALTLVCGAGLYWAFFASKSVGGMEAAVDRGTAEATRIAGVIFGAVLAAAFVCDRSFWERDKQFPPRES
jgi:hypothetical protein